MAVLIGLAAFAAPAQTFTTLVNFGGPNGSQPQYATLTQGVDGSYYGITSFGGTSPYWGTIYKVTASGALTTLHSFDFTDGSNPNGWLAEAPDGSFYGTTSEGGANGDYGTFFTITEAGEFTSLFSFVYANSFPFGGLIEAGGSFFGTTQTGGAPYGSIVKFSPAGALATLFTFGDTDGADPESALIEGPGGAFYGTTRLGGSDNNYGTVFKFNADGKLTTLHNFHSYDGAYPFGGLVLASDGNFYGTTQAGGATGHGTIFKLTPKGTLTTLHSFNGSDGGKPDAALIQATDGNLYGTTSMGGPNSVGTVFSITLQGVLTTLHNFSSGDGANPEGALLQATDGNFYGTTPYGGDDNYDGAIFKLSVGLGPFVKTLPTSGKVGTSVTILGTDLTGATSVTFGGSASAFTVVSPSAISAVVPAGAATGAVRVTTPNGTLTSNTVFTVRP